ncbi:MAG: NADH-quinone oxidoreductase subunit C [candidate division WOR-3 bacterium]|nr:NADH-quinone oxidoreductase subunit C [candidate division WOR-3 bacterium]MCX7837344.1 NADH-quinone oxidoreductase subunit C [candidate division WOR-3 bacterium]MDW8113816.1 NADH-quinone oxidoreductase subunit C [candidate division WOR-3 bacterium]
MNELLAEIKNRFPEIEVYEHNKRRLYLKISKEKIREIAYFLHKEKGLRLSIMTGIDTREGIEILYHFSDDKTGTYYTIRIFTERDNAKVDTISDITKASEWIEREIWELLGVEFIGHKNLKPLLTSEDWQRDKYPLRRDFEMI